MTDQLRFDPNAFTNKMLEVDGKQVCDKEYKSICYCEKPVDANAKVSPELKAIADMFNPMWHVLHDNPGCAEHWWIRHGGVDGATSVPTVLNLATALENRGKEVNAQIIWDGGHCEDDDPEGLMDWYCRVCGYQRQ